MDFSTKNWKELYVLILSKIFMAPKRGRHLTYIYQNFSFDSLSIKLFFFEKYNTNIH